MNNITSSTLWWLERATTFTIDFDDKEPVTIQRHRQTTGSDRWSVLCSGRVLNCEAQWEYDPLPSSRDSQFLQRCRFVDRETALFTYQQWKLANPITCPATLPVTLPEQ